MLVPYYVPSEEIRPMNPAVRAAFLSTFTGGLEGVTTWLYLDVLGLVTVGEGNLVDDGTGTPPARLYLLPWKNPDGSAATAQQIGDAWYTVKARRDMTSGGGDAFRGLTTIRLSSAAVQNLVSETLDQFEETLRTYYPAFDAWPSDAQLATLSMAWAMGPHFAPGYPHFSRAVNASPPDFGTAAKESYIPDGITRPYPPGSTNTKNPGLVARNAANKTMLENAAAVVRMGLDPTALWFPKTVTSAALKGGASILLLLAGIVTAAYFAGRS